MKGAQEPVSESAKLEPRATAAGADSLRRGDVVGNAMSAALRAAWRALAALGPAAGAVLIAEGRLEAAALTLVASLAVVLPGLAGVRTGPDGEAVPAVFSVREMVMIGAVLAILAGVIVYLVAGWHALGIFATSIGGVAAIHGVRALRRPSPSEIPASERFHELADPLRALSTTGGDSAAPASPPSDGPPPVRAESAAAPWSDPR